MSADHLPVLAITGGTGFVGGTLLRHAVLRHHRVRALTRRARPDMHGVTWISGSLDDAAALARLVAGADVVIHVAGVTTARDRAGFAAGNLDGTNAVIDAAGAAGIRRLVNVSSLAAREPDLSDYGWSKAQAERALAESGLGWVTVRPPAVYGPGERDILAMFRMARSGVAFLPPSGRLSVIEASDLSRLLLSLVDPPAVLGQVYEPDDGAAGGWTHAEFARAIGAAVGRTRMVTIHMPAALLRVAARLDETVRGSRAKLTRDRANYFSHPDWVVDPARRPPPDLWNPHIDTRAGLAATAHAYRVAGWL